MRVLYIASHQRTGGWLAEAFAADSASEVILDEAAGAAAGLARLRDETFDAVLVSHEPGELDALGLIEGYRAGGADEPIVILGNQSEQEMAALCYEVGADGYVCAHTTTTRNLLWILARAIQRHQLVRENRRLNLAERQRLQREHEEAYEIGRAHV
jgi:DNA-binding response OmpR family regulator